MVIRFGRAGGSINAGGVPRWRSVAASLAAASLAALPVYAQAPSRTELLEAARSAKVREVEPPHRTTGEKGLIAFAELSRFITAFQGGWRGVHFAGGDFPSGAGFAFGVGFTDLAVGSVNAAPDMPNRIDLHLNAASSTASYRQLSGDLAVLNIGGTPLNTSLHAQYFEYPEEDFFGIGPGTLEANRTTYFLGGSRYGANVWVQPLRWLRVGGGFWYLNPQLDSGEDSRFPSLEEIFETAVVPGFGMTPNFVRSDAFVEIDARDQPLFPRAGGLVSLRASSYKDQDLGAFDFDQYELDAHYYLSWLNKYRVLALRGNVVISDEDPGQQVPFFYMPTLGGGERLRGFREFRFRDRNSLLLTAEYRWEAWWPLEMAVFVDAGKVVADEDDLDFDDLEVGYGIGFRFHSVEAVSFRLDLANSHEGFFPLFRYEHVF